MYLTEADTYEAVSNLMAREADVVSGLGYLLEHCNRLCPSPLWGKIASLDLAGDSAYLKRWLQNLLETEPPGERIIAFWFGLFDEAEPDGRAFARLYFAGSEFYDPDDKTAQWAARPSYLPKGRYADSIVLRSMPTILRTATKEASWLGSYVLPLGFASLTVREACRQLPPEVLLGHRTSRAVAVGFDSGDFINIPSINRETPPR